MAQPVIVITFFCRNGETEKLALEAAVGAVQARGFIRLRRVPDLDSTSGNDELTRMQKEYVSPTEKDLLGADALILVTSEDVPFLGPTWQPFREMVSRLRDEAKLADKIAGGLGVSSAALRDLGLALASEKPLAPLTLGRTAVQAVQARHLKT